MLTCPRAKGPLPKGLFADNQPHLIHSVDLASAKMANHDTLGLLSGSHTSFNPQMHTPRLGVFSPPLGEKLGLES